MFIGTRFCGLCGAVAAPVETDLTKEAGDCPRCHQPLETLYVGETHIRGCSKCEGLWMDVTTFENVCADRERQSLVLGYLEKRPGVRQPPTKIAYVPCPDCGELMNRNNFAKASGVIVDICKQHGVWFDADELPAIIEFIRRGGMELAREKEKIEIRDQLSSLRDSDRRMQQFEQSFGGRTTWSDADAAAGIRGFIHGLFE
jgi:Zn-finger nucleic acid-binding protein